MFQAYPKWIPMDNADPDNPKKQRLVQTEEHHKTHNMEHYQSEKAAAPVAPVSLNDAVAGERERAAMVAERFPGGQAIAAAIRTLPPTLREVMDAGYDSAGARAVVAEEQRKHDVGEPPYGPEATTSGSKPNVSSLHPAHVSQ